MRNWHLGTLSQSHCKSKGKGNWICEFPIECVNHLTKPIHPTTHPHIITFHSHVMLIHWEANTVLEPRTVAPFLHGWDSSQKLLSIGKEPTLMFIKIWFGVFGMRWRVRVLQWLTILSPRPRTGPHNLKGRKGSQDHRASSQHGASCWAETQNRKGDFQQPEWWVLAWQDIFSDLKGRAWWERAGVT